MPSARRSRLGGTAEPHEDSIERVHLPREPEQVERAQTVGDQLRMGGATRDTSQLAHEREQVPALPHVEAAGGEAVRGVDVGRGERQTSGQGGLEDPLGHLPDNRIPLMGASGRRGRPRGR